MAPPAAPTVPQHEETLWRGNPAWLLLLGKIMLIVATIIVIPVATYLAASGAPDLEARSTTLRTGWLITIFLLAIEVAFFAVALLKIRSTLYTITNQRVMIETGLISKALSEIDLRYVDDSQFSQSILHRLLGIGNVTIFSSDQTTPSYTLTAIRDPRNVRELIRSHAYKVSQKQVFTRVT